MAKELPKPKPEAPAAESQRRVKIRLGNKRYALTISVKAEELKLNPAPPVPLKP